MTFRKILAGIAVRDIEAAKIWYSGLFDDQPDRVPMPNDAGWDFGGFAVQIFSDDERAGSSTLDPGDIEQELSPLSELDHSPLSRNCGTFDVAIFHDADGDQFVLAQAG